MRFYSIILFGCFLLAVPLFPQSPEGNAKELSDISKEMKTTGADIQIVPKAPSPINPQESASLVQFDAQSRQNQLDPYPLQTYQGSFLTEDLKTIRDQFTVKNLPVVKATLERWYQKRDQSFPTEGYLMLAAIYDQLQCYDQAVTLLEDGKTQTTERKAQISFLLAQAQVLRHSGKDQEVLAVLTQISPKERSLYPEVFFNQGLSYLYLKSYDQAIINFRKYLSLVPDGVQSSNIRRAVAWLLLARNGQLPSSGGGEASSPSQQGDIQKMLQLLVEKQRATDYGNLSKSATTNIEDKSLHLAEKDLEDLEQYSNIAE